MDCDIFTFLWSLYIEISGSSHSKVFLKSKKKTEKWLWKSSFSCLFYKDFTKIESYFSFFLNKILNASCQIKPRFSFWLKINFRKMASNKHVDLRKIENFVRIKKRQLISENHVRTLKPLMRFQHTKKKDGWYLTIIGKI